MDVITYPCWVENQTLLITEDPYAHSCVMLYFAVARESIFMDSYGSGNCGVAVLLPGFAINR